MQHPRSLAGGIFGIVVHAVAVIDRGEHLALAGAEPLLEMLP
jgi:hypothetical protein